MFEVFEKQSHKYVLIVENTLWNSTEQRMRSCTPLTVKDILIFWLWQVL